jgi:phage tail-like protein
MAALEGDDPRSYRNRATRGDVSDVLVTYYFYVQGQAGDAISQAVFAEVSGLEVEIETYPYEEGGVNDHVHKLPGRVKVSDITLRNGVTNSRELWDWFWKTMHGQFERKNVSIIMVDQQGRERQRWNFLAALPIKWTGPQLKAEQSTLAIQTLVLTHRGLYVP